MSPTLRCTGAARLRPNSARYTRSAGMSPQSLTDGLSTSDVKFLNIVKDFGWHVMKVAPRVGMKDAFGRTPPGYITRTVIPKS